MFLKRVTSPAMPRLAMLGLAWFAFAWAVARACVQAVTGDEAQDYMFFAGTSHPTHWDAAVANHLLNSIGERIFTSVFGLSALTLRIPNLLGAALYIFVAYKLCELISQEWKVRIPLFLCLVYNPFVFDFYVAARSYGIADALLIAAVAITALYHRQKGPERELLAATAIASLCLGLAFSANFGLSLCGLTLLVLITLWALSSTPDHKWKVLASALLPGTAVVLFIPLWPLLHYHEKILSGTRSLKEMLISLVNGSMYEPSHYLITPLLEPVFDWLSETILPLTVLLALVQLGWILRDRVWKRSRSQGPERNPHTAWLCALGSLIGAVTVLAVIEHRLAYGLFDVLLPVSRTALFFIPLVTLIVGIAAAIPPLSRGGALFRNLLIASIWLLGGYYLFCMRLNYFEEWDYQQDLNPAYKVLACYNHEKNLQDVEVSWYYHAGMNLLRIMSGRETFGLFSSGVPHTTGHQAYVLEGNVEHDFIVSQGLTVVFHGAHTGMVVALKPDLADSQGQGCYVWPEYP